MERSQLRLSLGSHSIGVWAGMRQLPRCTRWLLGMQAACAPGHVCMCATDSLSNQRALSTFTLQTESKSLRGSSSKLSSTGRSCCI